MENLRIGKVREQLKQLGLDALLITNATNRKYLTGFTGTAGYVLLTADQAILFTDFRYMKQAVEQATDYQVIKHAAKASETIQDYLISLGVTTLGVEQNDLSFAAYNTYQDQLTGIEMVPTSDIVEHIRSFKDAAELSKIRRAIEITELAFEHILKLMKPGMTEQAVSAELEYYMRMHGAPSSAYSTIIASGERSALPHGLASDKKLGNNEFITLDFGASYGGYCSDLTRTVFIGTPSAKHKEMYAVVLEANQAALAGIKPGMTGREADALGRNVIEKHGYGEFFGHGLGHAFGLEIHEAVRLRQESQDILMPGMVITVEPGIYLPDFCGVRIEDDILITETGIEVLTHANKELILL